jgi:hypothetical protein
MSDTYTGWSQEDTNDISEEQSKMHDEKHEGVHEADGTSFKDGKEKAIAEQIAKKTKNYEAKVILDEALEKAKQAHLRKLDNRYYDPDEDITARIIKQG